MSSTDNKEKVLVILRKAKKTNIVVSEVKKVEPTKLSTLKSLVKPKIICSCKDLILRSNKEDEVTVTNKVVVTKGSRVFAVCSGCGEEVELPMDYRPDKAIERPKTSPKLYIAK